MEGVKGNLQKQEMLNSHLMERGTQQAEQANLARMKRIAKTSRNQKSLTQISKKEMIHLNQIKKAMALSLMPRQKREQESPK